MAETSLDVDASRLYAHMDKVLRTSVAHDVVFSDSGSFASKVAGLYDAQIHQGMEGHLSYALNDGAVSEGTTTIEDLVSLLEPFSADPLPYDSLGRDLVRDAIKRYISRKKRGSILVGAGILGAFTGGAVATSPDMKAYAFILLSAGAVLGSIGLFISNNARNESLMQLDRLYNAALKADDFVNEHYRPYLLRKRD